MSQWLLERGHPSFNYLFIVEDLHKPRYSDISAFALPSSAEVSPYCTLSESCCNDNCLQNLEIHLNIQAITC